MNNARAWIQRMESLHGVRSDGRRDLLGRLAWSHAVHEAGHAVVGRSFGYLVSLVEFLPDDPDRNGHTVALGVDTRHIDAAAFSLAGFAAERELALRSGEGDPYEAIEDFEDLCEGDPDWTAAVDICEQLDAVGDEDSPHRGIFKAWEKAKAAVYEHWDEIELLASAVMEGPVRNYGARLSI